MNLSKKIKNARIKSNLTQGQVAENLNISRKTLSSWENNRSSPDIESIKKLAIILNVDINYLLDIKNKDKDNIKINMEKNSKKHFMFYLLNYLNMILLSMNCTLSLFLNARFFGITLSEIVLAIILMQYYKIKNIKVSSIQYKSYTIIISFLLFLFISYYHLELITYEINIFHLIGVLIKTTSLTVCFYIVLMFLHTNND